MARKLLAIVIALAAISAPAFGDTDGTGFRAGPCTIPDGHPNVGSGDVRYADPSNVQAVVDSASEGDTILLQAGVYSELVIGTHKHPDGTSETHGAPGLRIRGLDRNEVVFDGRSELEIGIAVTSADRVLIENMTAHNYTRHGFYWHHVTGYWGRWLTAYNNGLYGVYAFDARCGQFNDSYTSGNADSGFYIGECFPCDAVITGIVAERNALGYSGTNAGGGLVLRDSIWRNNAMAIVPNSLDGEDRPPQRGVTIARNLIENNNNITAPGVSLAGTYYGVGIAIAGGNSNEVYGNTILDHQLAGIVLSPLPDQNVWLSSGNTIWANTVTHPDAAGYERAIDLAQAASSGPGNCWADNVFGTSAPVLIQEIYSCSATLTPPGGDPRVEQGLIEGAAGLNGRQQSDWRTYPAPSKQASHRDKKCDEDGGCEIKDWLPALGL